MSRSINEWWGAKGSGLVGSEADGKEAAMLGGGVRGRGGGEGKGGGRRGQRELA